MSHPDWPPPDEHLRAALRHAPDRDLQPPTALSALILAESRQAVATPNWLQRVWAALARPAGAAAFASVVLAGFIGLMWQDGPPPAVSSLPPAVPVPPSTAAPAPAAAKAIAPATDASNERAALPAARESRARQAAPAAAPAPEALSRRREATDAEARQGMARDAAAERQATGGMSAVPTVDPLSAAVAALQAGDKASSTAAVWREVQAAAGGRWRAMPTPLPPGATALHGPDGTVLGHWNIEGSLLRWQPVPGPLSWQVDLPPPTLERLRTEAPR